MPTIDEAPMVNGGVEEQFNPLISEGTMMEETSLTGGKEPERFSRGVLRLAADAAV